MRPPSQATETSIAATRLIQRHVIAGYFMGDGCPSLELERKSLSKGTRAVVDPMRALASVRLSRNFLSFPNVRIEAGVPAPFHPHWSLLIFGVVLFAQTRATRSPHFCVKGYYSVAEKYRRFPCFGMRTPSRPNTITGRAWERERQLPRAASKLKGPCIIVRRNGSRKDGLISQKVGNPEAIKTLT